MFSSIVSGVVAALKLAATAMGWIKQNKDQADGAAMQREKDQAQTIKDASDVNKADIQASASGMSAERQRLLDESRPG